MTLSAADNGVTRNQGRRIKAAASSRFLVGTVGNRGVFRGRNFNQSRFGEVAESKSPRRLLAK
jgi:hypothetical protein